MEPYENKLPGMFFHPSAICNHICSTLLENFCNNTITVTLKMSIVNYLEKKTHLHSVYSNCMWLESVFKNYKILGLAPWSLDPLFKYFKTDLPTWVASAWTAEAALVEMWLHSWEVKQVLHRWVDKIQSLFKIRNMLWAANSSPLFTNKWELGTLLDLGTSIRSKKTSANAIQGNRWLRVGFL